MAEPIRFNNVTTKVGPGISTATERASQAGVSRVRLLDLAASSVEDLRRERHERTAEDFCESFQVCLPYRGLGIWHVGGRDIVADCNQVLFVRGGEEYRTSGPVPGGYAELIFTPDIELLSELVCADGPGLFSHPLFRRRSGPAPPFLQAFRTRFLNWLTPESHLCHLEAEESVVALLRTALQQGNECQTDRCGVTSARLIQRTKQFLEEQLSAPIRLREIGRAVGASPAYLTDLFRRVEGVSLHQYLTQLRLARALAELPHTENLTELALDTGFSSHSHFSAAFRRAFGDTPSEYREQTRRHRRPVAPALLARSAPRSPGYRKIATENLSPSSPGEALTVATQNS